MCGRAIFGARNPDSQLPPPGRFFQRHPGLSGPRAPAGVGECRGSFRALSLAGQSLPTSPPQRVPPSHLLAISGAEFPEWAGAVPGSESVLPPPCSAAPEGRWEPEMVSISFIGCHTRNQRGGPWERMPPALWEPRGGTVSPGLTGAVTGPPMMLRGSGGQRKGQ